jgi:hypothetical protein
MVAPPVRTGIGRSDDEMVPPDAGEKPEICIGGLECPVRVAVSATGNVRVKWHHVIVQVRMALSTRGAGEEVQLGYYAIFLEQYRNKFVRDGSQ